MPRKTVYTQEFSAAGITAADSFQSELVRLQKLTKKLIKVLFVRKNLINHQKYGDCVCALFEEKCSVLESLSIHFSFLPKTKREANTSDVG